MASQPSESRFDGLTFPSYMAAGAVAGIAEHIAMYPVDTVKTRMQALAQPGQNLHGSSVRRALMSIVKREGMHGLYRGVGAVAWSAGPAHALYFATYETAKHALGGNTAEHAPLASACAGSLATAINDAIMTPGDVVKQRLQIADSPYKGLVDCALRTYREEGAGAFYRSYKTTLLMNVPLTAVHFSTYESVKKLLVNDPEEEGLLVQVVAGGVAGGLSAGVTNPLDVVKTRLQTEGMLSHRRTLHSTAVLDKIRTIIATEGHSGLWRGVSARIYFHVPAAAVCWGTYESLKTFLIPR